MALVVTGYMALAVTRISSAGRTLATCLVNTVGEQRLTTALNKLIRITLKIYWRSFDVVSMDLTMSWS
jgi:hypothetical protein